jgi:prepilin-type processing-associated H-X9-DG protein
MIAMGDASFEADGYLFGSTASPLCGVFDLKWTIIYRVNWDLTMNGLPPGDRGAKATKQRHSARWNVSFCDGHVENLRPGNLFGVTNPLVAQRWNVDHQPHLGLVGLPFPP